MVDNALPEGRGE